jgi:pimeloyl-ACP methyl ester carboxylesterase
LNPLLGQHNLYGPFYKEEGSGQPVVLLHGFLESHKIWHEISPALSTHFRIIAFDLPGFGLSGLPGADSFSLSDIAVELIKCLKTLTSEKVSIVGHSLGGYVALAMVEFAPELFCSLTLFHSTAFADTDEKKGSRTKTIEFVERNGVLAFTSNFVTPLFANPRHEAIPFVTELASQTSLLTVVRYLSAMRDRPEQLKTIENFKGRILFLAGSADSVIRPESLREQAKLSKNGFLEVFEGVGHMGMLESPQHSVKVLTKFLIECGH